MARAWLVMAGLLVFAVATVSLAQPGLEAAGDKPPRAIGGAALAGGALALDRTLLQMDPRLLLGRGRVFSPDKIPPRFGVALIEDPTKTKQPGAGPAVQDLTATASAISWKGRNFAMKDLRTDLPVRELPPVVMAIDRVERVHRGWYVIHFRYSIFKPEEVTLPVRFQLDIQGEARPHMGWIPYVHSSGPALNCNGRVTAVVMGEGCPLAAESTAIGINAADSSTPPKSVGSVSKPLIAQWFKRYADITRDDIKGYIEAPGSAHESLGVHSGAKHVVMLQNIYSEEPALLLFKTSRGNYTKSLIKAERDSGSKPYHLRVVAAHTYAKSAAEFNAAPGVAPGSPANEEYMCHWEDSGYILSTWSFDFDWLGMNTSGFESDKWKEDIWVQSSGGVQTIRCRNDARIAY